MFFLICLLLPLLKFAVGIDGVVVGIVVGGADVDAWC